jgi:hypothetical protein
MTPAGIIAEAAGRAHKSALVAHLRGEPAPTRVDYRSIYETRRKELARYIIGDEPHFRAFDHAVGCDLEEAKRQVRAAIDASKTKEGNGYG